MPATETSDVMEIEIPPEQVAIEWELLRWLGGSGDESLHLNEWEYSMCRDFVRVLRHEGPMRDFLRKAICDESFALQFGQRPRLTVEELKELADAAFIEPHAAAA